ARARNEMMPSHMLELAQQAANEKGIDIKKAKVAILGASFIENSEDTRNSPTETLIEILNKEGIKWAIHDPYVRPREFPHPVSKDLDEVTKDADVVMIFVKHKEYFDIKAKWLKENMKTSILIDGRDVLNLAEFKKEDFIAYGIGKPNFG
ncbi:MAG: UDP binding domain-containing protein, partial [Candidatus Heimdallarchaeota archaeon]